MREATPNNAGACRVLKGDYIEASGKPGGGYAGACRVLKGDGMINS